MSDLYAEDPELGKEFRRAIRQFGREHVDHKAREEGLVFSKDGDDHFGRKRFSSEVIDGIMSGDFGKVLEDHGARLHVFKENGSIRVTVIKDRSFFGWLFGEELDKTEKEDLTKGLKAAAAEYFGGSSVAFERHKHSLTAKLDPSFKLPDVEELLGNEFTQDLKRMGFSLDIKTTGWLGSGDVKIDVVRDRGLIARVFGFDVMTNIQASRVRDMIEERVGDFVDMQFNM